MSVIKLFSLGTTVGLLFAYAHVYENLKLDLPLYGIFILIETLVACTGRGCLPYLWGGMAISALIWGAVALIIGFGVQKWRGNTSDTVADDTDPGV